MLLRRYSVESFGGNAFFGPMLITFGLCFVFLGTLILIYPKLLALLVSFALIFVGIGFLGFGTMIRKAERRTNTVVMEPFDRP